MKIPKKHVEDWIRELIDECLVSRPDRVSAYQRYRDIYYTGSDSEAPSKRPRIYSHIDKLSSYLFSPSDVHFNVEFDDDTQAEWTKIVGPASSYLNRQFSRRHCDVKFSQANEWALVKGSSLMKLTWSRGGFEPWVIQPENFGVLREDIEDLDRQDAFVHTFYLTPTQFRRMLGDHPDKTEIMAMAEAGLSQGALGDGDSRMEVFIGGGFPNVFATVPGVTSPQPTQTGTVDYLSYQPGAMLAPEVYTRLIQVYDLWVWNDDREDWTTLRFAEPGILIEGKYQHRNLSDAPGEHPFVKVCTNQVPGYFWGRSEISNVWPIQRLLTARLNNLDAIYNLKAKPARSVIGGSITDEKVRTLLSPGGVVTDPNPNTKIETYSPDVPQGMLEFMGYLDGAFDEAAGFTAITSGQGEPGVRAGSHANTLLRTSTPRLRDRALLAEKQVAGFGDLALKMLRAKDASVLRGDEGFEFTMAQVPEDASVVVDSHTSSPAFSGDNIQLMFNLMKAGAIGPIELLEGVHPPRQDVLVARHRSSEKAHQAMLEQVKTVDPEAWAKAVSGGGSRRR
jgi:hypothetical protein